jgi:HSP20 family protein
MTNLTRYNPFHEMEALMERFHRSFGLAPRRSNGQEGLALADWTPAVDIREDENEFQLQMDLPQVEAGDIKVTVEDGVLMIRGERKSESEESDPNAKWHRIERFHGTFARSFTLPENVRDDSVDAKFEKGVLTVHLPKAKPAQPKAREVQIRAQ